MIEYIKALPAVAILSIKKVSFFAAIPKESKDKKEIVTMGQPDVTQQKKLGNMLNPQVDHL